VLSNERGQSTTTSYDAAGRPVTIIDANNRVKTMVWDAASNLTSCRYSDGTFVTQQFDSLNRLTAAIDWAGDTTFAYSPRSELLGKSDPGGLAQAYRYDPLSIRIGLTDPDGGLVTTTFDALNRTSSVQSQTGQIYTPQYDPDGRRTTLALGTGIIRQYGRDHLGRITTQIDYAGAAPISTMIDGYDGVGNRVSRLQDGVAISWTHDNNYRLLGQQTAGAYATMTYNAVGSTLVKWHQGQPPQTMVYDSNNAQVTSTSGDVITSFGYDNMGNQTAQNTGPVIRSSWDPENRLIGISNPDGTLSSYTYQGYDGMRRSAWEPGQALTTFVWDWTSYLGEY
jgi:YD repeat-containing protein